jgi:hypothetical protein
MDFAVRPTPTADPETLRVITCLMHPLLYPREATGKQRSNPFDEGLDPRGSELPGRADQLDPFVHLTTPLGQDLDERTSPKVTDHRPLAKPHDPDPLARRFEEGANVV